MWSDRLIDLCPESRKRPALCLHNGAVRPSAPRWSSPALGVDKKTTGLSTGKSERLGYPSQFRTNDLVPPGLQHREEFCKHIRLWAFRHFEIPRSIHRSTQRTNFICCWFIREVEITVSDLNEFRTSVVRSPSDRLLPALYLIQVIAICPTCKNERLRRCGWPALMRLSVCRETRVDLMPWERVWADLHSVFVG